MQTKLISLIVLSIFLVSFVSANLGTYKQGDCVNIKTILNSSSVNISTISYPNSIVVISNQIMTKQGQTFNYTFCNTSNLGTYIYDYFDSNGDVYVNSFDVTPNGNTSTTSDSINMIWQVVVLIIALICFMVMGVIFKIDAVKIFFFVLAGLTLFILVGLGLSTAQNYLYAYTQYGNVYSAYYIVLATVGGTAIIGLIVWLIYYVFQKFAKTKIGDIE